MEFLRDNWRLLLEAVCVIASLVFCLIRKKPVKVVDTLKEIIVRLLPALINNAEGMEGLKGEAKLKVVISELVLILKDLGYSDEVIDPYLPFAKEQVEVILSTPQKKVR